MQIGGQTLLVHLFFSNVLFVWGGFIDCERESLAIHRPLVTVLSLSVDSLSQCPCQGPGGMLRCGGGWIIPGCHPAIGAIPGGIPGGGPRWCPIIIAATCGGGGPPGGTGDDAPLPPAAPASAAASRARSIARSRLPLRFCLGFTSAPSSEEFKSSLPGTVAGVGGPGEPGGTGGAGPGAP